MLQVQHQVRVARLPWDAMKGRCERASEVVENSKSIQLSVNQTKNFQFLR
jgi:hypothetical protein